jgi:hypothetical protein
LRGISGADRGEPGIGAAIRAATKAFTSDVIAKMMVIYAMLRAASGGA